MTTRRQFLAGSIAAASSLGGFPAPYLALKPDIKLRVLGTHVTLQEELRLQAQRELGFKIEFYPGGSSQVLYQASTRPESFDLYEQWSDSIKVLWNSGAIQPIETERITRWKEINSLAKTGKLTETARMGAGDAPVKLLYIQNNNTIGPSPTNRVSFLPYVHNVDSFGYNASVVPEGTPYDSESWSWLLDERWQGRAALVNTPTIGIFDMALAASAAGLMTFKDIGELTREEIDCLFDLYLSKQSRGHFRGLWNSVPTSVEWMQNGDVVIESMFSPAVSSLNGRGIRCIYAAPKEGYRAWHGVMCLSSKTSGYVKDAAYDYMNWWLSGWPGAFIARQGYYISNPETSRSYLSAAEWDYWYAGKCAITDLPGTDGSTAVRTGEVRRGGTYEQRFSNIAVWNTVMNTWEYSLQRWGELLT